MTTTTTEVVELFVTTNADNVKASGNRLRIEGNKLINYSTIIGLKPSDGCIYINDDWYSSTTTKHTNRLKRQARFNYRDEAVKLVTEEEIYEEEQPVREGRQDRQPNKNSIENKAAKENPEKTTKRRKAIQKRKIADQSVVPLHSTDRNNETQKIFLVAPKKYDQAQEVSKHLKNGFPVIVNLENLELDTAKQLVDFVSGTVFALDGNLHKIGQHIFLFSPPNVDIDGGIDASGEDLFDIDPHTNQE